MYAGSNEIFVFDAKSGKQVIINKRGIATLIDPKLVIKTLVNMFEAQYCFISLNLKFKDDINKVD